jgi:signal transduction histidine kinase
MLWERMSDERDEPMAPESVAEGQQRARFKAVRRRVFEEMHEIASRKRTAILVPYHVLVVIVLAARGEPLFRVGIQIGAVAAFMLLVGRAERSAGVRAAFWFALTVVAAFAWVANTGGLASPLLLSTVPFVLGMAMNPQLESRRGKFLVAMLLGYAALAAASHTWLGELVGPLAPSMRWASSEYVMLSLASAAMATFAIFKMGHAMTQAYERIVLELAARREELCDESEGRTRALEGIAARLAHEVKNPLAAIKGLSTHMARQVDDPKVKERLAIVAGEADRLQGIVDGFLSFSRGLDELSLGPTRPYDIARELSLLLETRAADAGVTLEVRGTRELALNAMQASPPGSTVTIEVAKCCGDGAAVVKVMDRGAGMTPEVLERIRRPYFTTKEGGSGLGIAVARALIEQHGGNLRFESAEGRGTTATVSLPASAAEAGKEAKLPMCRSEAVPVDVKAIEPAALRSEKVPS